VPRSQPLRACGIKGPYGGPTDPSGPLAPWELSEFSLPSTGLGPSGAGQGGTLPSP
jgi:hypothetical protein